MTQSSGSHRQPAPVTHLDDRRAAPKILGAIQLVRKHSKATGSARAVLNVLAGYADADGTGIKVGTERLARESGLSIDTVKRARKRLVQLGEVEIIVLGTGSRATHYRLRLERYPIEQGVQVATPRGVYVATPGGVQVAPQPSIDRPDTGGRTTPPRCSRHVGVVDPPPCRACRGEREAADAAAFAAASTAHVASTEAGRAAARAERLDRADPATRARRLEELRRSTDRTRTGTLPTDEPKG